MRVPEDADALASARRRWPEISCEASVFAAYVEARRSEGPGLAAAELSQLNLADLYLVCAYLQGNGKAAEILETQYLKRMPAMIGHLGLNQSQMVEVVDEVRGKLLLPPVDGTTPGIGAYRGRGALMEWLRVTVLRTGLHLLSSKSERQRAAEEVLVLVGQDPTLRQIKGIDVPVLLEAVRVAFADLSQEDRTLLRLHYVDGLEQKEIALALGLHKSSISRRLEKARSEVAQRTRSYLMSHLRISPGSAESLLHFLQSQMDLRLSQLL